MRAIRRSVAVLGTVLVAVVALPVAALADAGTTGRDFGGHVVVCAQTMGFDAQHNPGMHQGFSDWDPSHTC
ncbi:hypothetical protein V6U81_19265 [Micromonospora sp. CPCC 205711]|uniref:hypothetical protein n=1 Tax=Micromonospora sp. CPCC 205547 TaxID=3122400 RepID=UPI002FF217B5